MTVVEEPLVGSASILADSVLAPTYRRPDTVFVDGKGAWLTDSRGRRFLDFSSGICVNALGHAAPEVVDTIRDRADQLIHTSNLFHTEPAVRLAADLTALSFADRVFFCNSGAEANEAAIKFARLCGGNARRAIVSFAGSFHGRTLGTLSATDRPDASAPFAPLVPGFRQAEWNDPRSLDCIREDVAAAIVEPVQGEAGVRVADPAWLRRLRERCTETGAALIFDEVQTGLGRCGTLWAYEGAGVVPDLMTLAKPLAGGLPIGAVLMRESIGRQLTPGCHATTFGGGPLVTSVARQVLRSVARPEFLEAVQARGKRLLAGLGALSSPLVVGVRGRGLLIGVKVRKPQELQRAAFDQELLVVPAGDDVLRFIPPLNVTDAEVDEALARFGRALEAVAEEESR